MEYIVAIDLGGMSAKGALFSLDNQIICECKTPTNALDGFEGTVQKLSDLFFCLLEKSGVKKDEVRAVGVGAPGVVDSTSGCVLRWTNFGWNDVPLAKRLSALTGIY